MKTTVSMKPCRKVNIASPSLLSLERLAYKIGHGWHLGTITLGSFPLIPELKWITAPQLSVKTMQFMLNTCFPSGSLEFWYMLHRECLCDQHPVQTFGIESLLSFPDHISHMLSQLLAGAIGQVLCDFTGRGPGEACSLFPPDLAASWDFSVYWFCSVSFHCKKPQPRKWQHAESCGSC